jgi:hypothetical protein
MHRITYRRNDWRIVGLLAYLGLPIVMIGFAARQGNLGSGELWAATGGWMLLGLLPLLWTFQTKLDLSDECLTLCEGVFTLRAPWKNIRALDLTPNAEGLVLHQPLADKSARRLRFWAFANRWSPTGALKGGVQRYRWISEGRFIPLQAFGKVVQSPEFHRQLLERIPNLELLSPAEVALETERSDRARNIWTFGD